VRPASNQLLFHLTQYFLEAEWFKLHSITLVKFAVKFNPKTQTFPVIVTSVVTACSNAQEHIGFYEAICNVAQVSVNALSFQLTGEEAKSQGWTYNIQLLV